MTQRVAVVTGGTRGIGRAISQSLKDDGYIVVAIYQSNDEAAAKFKSETGCEAIKLDVTDFDKCQSALDKVEEDFGPIGVLVNNAGITRDGVLHKMPVENWNDVIQTNLTSCFNMCRAVITNMRNRKFGRIVNISSINGQKGQFGQVNYSAAKAGMIGFTKALALESAIKNVTVNTVCPGYIETDMTANISKDILDTIIKQIPEMRMGQPEEIAAIVSFLASEKAAFVTGSTISANGGQYMA
ncbi:MAG: acetoacetyl-CoA reductase [Alphaproteobacteria bacterium]